MEQIYFFGKELQVLRPNLKLKDHPLVAVRKYLFTIFAATFYSSTRRFHPQLRTLNGVVTRVTRDPISMKITMYIL
jgi:hypothetical protein